MKKINTYINERLHITSKSFYTCHPETKDELREIIIQRIKDDGPKCDLNDIDVSHVTNMRKLFDADDNEIFKKFNGNVSMWDVSNVNDMYSMFYECEKFNCDLSGWNVSNVEDMRHMFFNCNKFKQNIDNWNVSNVKKLDYAFKYCPTTPKWYNRNKWE